jgi:hypothetical protein
MRRVLERAWIGAIATAALGGCVPWSMTGESTALVPNNPFGAQAQPTAQSRSSFAPGSKELSLRVEAVGRKLLTDNPQIGLRPLFASIGAPNPEVFHVDERIIYLTDGLTKQCKTDSELAAILSIELGKMVAEREVRASRNARNPERLPPIQAPVGGAAQGVAPDLTAVAELAKFEKANPRIQAALPRPNPIHLARTYMDKAGYQVSDLESVEPFLQAAERNVTFERLYNGALPQSKWAPK